MPARRVSDKSQKLEYEGDFLAVRIGAEYCGYFTCVAFSRCSQRMLKTTRGRPPIVVANNRKTIAEWARPKTTLARS